jgi:hypothetical protein
LRISYALSGSELSKHVWGECAGENEKFFIGKFCHMPRLYSIICRKIYVDGAVVE